VICAACGVPISGWWCTTGNRVFCSGECADAVCAIHGLPIDLNGGCAGCSRDVARHLHRPEISAARKVLLEDFRAEVERIREKESA
jgi:hypothetical protein